MSNRRSIVKPSVLLFSLILVVSIFTSTAMTGNYAVAQNSSSSNMTSTSVNNATSSNECFRFEQNDGRT